jgi:hypothetical protein
LVSADPPQLDSGNVTPFCRAGVLSNFTINIGGGQDVDGDLVVAVNINGTDTTMKVTVPAGTVHGALYRDDTSIVTVNEGDLFSLHVNNLVSASVAAKVCSYTINFN